MFGKKKKDFNPWTFTAEDAALNATKNRLKTTAAGILMTILLYKIYDYGKSSRKGFDLAWINRNAFNRESMDKDSTDQTEKN